MKIIADENIPYVEQVFGQLGQVQCVPGRAMNRALMADADVLLVRSITRVDEALLAGSPVGFVGTATIGMDHIDRDYLAKRQIAFTSAAGSNANSVVEYVITSILVLARRFNQDLQGKTLGIIGVGNIGGRLEKKITALGMTPLPNDPPLRRQTRDKRFVSLEKTLTADFVTCHVPLTRNEQDATYHLLNEKNLSLLSPNTVLLNSSRGAVTDNQALLNHFAGPLVLDVWENEPDIDVALLEKTLIATPHIAGYSFDGKVNGTAILYQKLCEHKQIPAELDVQSLMPAPPVEEIKLTTSGLTDQDILTRAMLSIYDIKGDDERMRAITKQPTEDRPGYFDTLRKKYPIRREAHNTQVILRPHRESAAAKLSTLGFVF